MHSICSDCHRAECRGYVALRPYRALQTGARHHSGVICKWPEHIVCSVERNRGRCESACPAVPIQEIYLMQFSSQTPQDTRLGS